MRNQLFFLLILSLFLQTCANQTQPTGGPKDETPPALISSIPADGTVNYTRTEIRLLFDEDVVLKNPKAQILITPRTTVNYDIKVRRTEVILEFDSLLDENTTYTINFRESIQDLTEGNPAERLKLAFSTGPNLDSLQLHGNVYRLLDGDIPEIATVALYRITDTTNIFTDLPYYFTQTTDSGKFELTNIKAGEYRLYAFQDYNNNLKAESSKEPYGFYPDTLAIIPGEEPYIQIPLISLDLGAFRMLSNRESGNLYVVKYNKNVATYKYRSADSLVVQPDPTDKSVLNLFPTRVYTDADSTQIILDVSDSLSNHLYDTLYASFNSSSTRSIDYSTRVNIEPVIVKNPTFQSLLLFSKPSEFSITDSIYLQIDSAFRVPVDSMNYSWSQNHDTLKLSYKLNPRLFQSASDNANPDKRTMSVRPFFRVGYKAISSIQNDSIKGRSLQLSFLRDQDVSRLILQLNTTVPHFILQLINESDEVYREVINPDTRTVYFNNLPPGNYRMRAIVDRNNNGKWDPGNFYDNLPPEPIIYLIPKTGNKTIELRANFEFEEPFSF